MKARFFIWAVSIFVLLATIQDSRAQSITLTGPSTSTTIAEGDDYATQVLGNPWDMRERRDIGWEENFDGTSIEINNGVWTGTNSTNDGYVLPLFGGFKNLLHAEGLPGDKSLPRFGINHPIDTSKYTMVSYRSKHTYPSSYAIFWNNDISKSYWPEGENVGGSYDGFFHNSRAYRYDGWNTYSFDMTDLDTSFAMPSGSWTGSIYSLRLDVSVGSGAGEICEIDWIRVVDPNSAPTINITWDSSNLAEDGLITIYMDNDNQGYDGTPIAVFANDQATSGSYALKTAILPPNTYYFYVTSRAGTSLTQEARSTYSARLKINAAPWAHFTSPTSLTGDSYATDVLGDEWDMENPEDVSNIGSDTPYPLQQISNWSFVNGVFQAVADPPIEDHTESDAQVHMRISEMTPIDTSKYRYVSYKLAIDESQYPTLDDKIREGWVARSVMWNTGISVDGVLPPDHILYAGWHTYTYDMKGDNAGQGLLGMGVPYTSQSYIKNFRVDPLETNLPTWFYLDWVKFTADNRAKNDSFDVSFSLDDIDDWNFDVALYYDTNDQDFDGTLITTFEQLSKGEHSYTWDTSNLQNGQHYYLYIEVNDGYSTSRAYSPVHVIIGNSSSTNTKRMKYDYDGDGISDQVVFRPMGNTGSFFLNQSSTGLMNIAWGMQGDIPIEGDFDGDKRSDIAIVRTDSNGFLHWYIRRSSDGELYYRSWGLRDDKLVAADYNGDGKTDIAVYRAGMWYVLYEDGTILMQPWGIVGDIPVSGDFDGDGKADIGIWRPSDGYWWIVNSGFSTGDTEASHTVLQWGGEGDQPIYGDFTGNGQDDMVIRWVKQSKWWIVEDFETRQNTGTQWGLPWDTTLVGDFNGDGTLDLSVVRPDHFIWYHNHRNEGDNYTAVQWGLPGDLVPQ